LTASRLASIDRLMMLINEYFHPNKAVMIARKLHSNAR